MSNQLAPKLVAEFIGTFAFVFTAIAQNLKQLAKLLLRPPPAAQ